MKTFRNVNSCLHHASKKYICLLHKWSMKFVIIHLLCSNSISAVIDLYYIFPKNQVLENFSDRRQQMK